MSESRAPAKIDFPAWKLQFRNDSERHGRLSAFDVMGDLALPLRLLWERGLEPTVEAVVEIAAQEETELDPKR